MRRATDARCSALMVTVDSPIARNAGRDLQRLESAGRRTAASTLAKPGENRVRPITRGESGGIDWLRSITLAR